MAKALKKSNESRTEKKKYTSPTEFVFSEEECKQKSVSVTLGKEKYLLIEPDTELAEAYQNRISDSTSMEMSKGKTQSSIEGMGTTQSWLLAKCLFLGKANEDGTRDPISLQVLTSLPSRITQPLVKWCIDASGLSDTEEEAEDKAKK